MPCEIYEKLSKQIESAQQDWAHWAYKDNPRRGGTKEQQKRGLEEAFERRRLLMDELREHKSSCEICNVESKRPK